jgi:hypothetical protein
MPKRRELAWALAAIARSLPGSYDRLAAALAEQPVDVQLEFHRLVQSFDQELAAARRRAAHEPWRR